MPDQLVTLEQLFALGGGLAAIAAGLTTWIVKRLDRLADAIAGLRLTDAQLEVTAERRYATHQDLDRLEARLGAELVRIREELTEIHKEIAGKSGGRST